MKIKRGNGGSTFKTNAKKCVYVFWERQHGGTTFSFVFFFFFDLNYPNHYDAHAFFFFGSAANEIVKNLNDILGAFEEIYQVEERYKGKEEAKKRKEEEREEQMKKYIDVPVLKDCVSSILESDNSQLQPRA